MKLLNNNTYLLLIDETAELAVGDIRLDYYVSGNPADIRLVTKVEGDKIFDGNITYNTKNSVHKIIAYYPLTKEAKELDLPLLPNPFKINIEELATEYNKENCISEFNPQKDIYAKGIITGWKQCFKAAQSKQFSLEDVRKAIEMARKTFPTDKLSCDRYSTEEIIQSLSTKQLPKEFECRYDKYCSTGRKCDNKGNNCYEAAILKIKTITNQQGKQEICGTYKY